MAGASLIVDDAEVLAAFERARAALSDLTPLKHDIGQGLVVSTQQRFETGRGRGGISWVPLAPATRRRKAAAGRTKVLVWSARLRNSITYQVSPTDIQVGTNVHYAAIHQFGGDIQIAARGQMARRRTRTWTRTNKDGTETVFRKGRFAKLQRTKAGGFKPVRDTEVEGIEIGAYTIHIPARPYLVVDDGDIAMITGAVDANIAAAIGGAT